MTDSSLTINKLVEMQSSLAIKQMIIIKFTADWCAPCQGIKPIVDEYLEKLPQSINYIEIDVDESIELYSFLKTKKMLNGIPAILAFYPGTKDTVYIPDDSVLGGNKNEVAKFFQRCINYVS